jgi:hypothetical protein
MAQPNRTGSSQSQLAILDAFNEEKSPAEVRQALLDAAIASQMIRRQGVTINLYTRSRIRPGKSLHSLDTSKKNIMKAWAAKVSKHNLKRCFCSLCLQRRRMALLSIR